MEKSFKTPQQKRFYEAYLALRSAAKAAKAVGLSPDYARHLVQDFRKRGILPELGAEPDEGLERNDSGPRLTREQREAILSRIALSPLTPVEVQLKAIDILNKLGGDYRERPGSSTSVLDLRIGRTKPTPGELEAARREGTVDDPELYRPFPRVSV